MYQRLGNPAGANGGPRSAGRIASNLVYPSPRGEGRACHDDATGDITCNNKTIYACGIGLRDTIRLPFLDRA